MLEKNIKEIINQVRDEAAEKGIVASIALHREKSHLMRIGNNSVSLNTSESLARLDVEVIDGKKQGSHTQLGTIKSVEYVRKALEIAVEKSKVAKPKDYQPIPVVIEKNIDETDQYDEALENVDPAFKAESYEKIFKGVGEDYNFSGSWSSGSTEIYLVSTANKNEAYHKGTDQLFNVVLKHPVKMWEMRLNQAGWRKDHFVADKIIEGFKKLVPVYENNGGYKVAPGEYRVAFGAAALAEIVMMATFTGLSGQSWEEKQGWTAKNQIGDLILGENVTIVDDPTDNSTFKFGFDFAGLARKPFSLVENGKLTGLMYDNQTAAKYSKEQTGHSLDSTSVVMKAGDGEKDILEATKGMGKVLYIPALHYVNLPNFSKGIFTGSSRFNAVLIEDGEIKSPIFSSRVTDSFQNVFGNILKISSASASVNESNTYGRRAPVAYSVPTYIISDGVKITDCADSF